MKAKSYFKLIVVFAIHFPLVALSQDEENDQRETLRAKYNFIKTEVKVRGKDGKKKTIKTRYKNSYSAEWYKFEIPQIINGSNISPLPVDWVSSDVTDSKLSGQFGFSWKKTKVAGEEDYLWTSSIGANVAATDGASVLVKTGNSPVTYGGQLGVSRILSHTIYCTDKSGTQTSYTTNERITHPKTTEKVTWATLNVSLNKASYNIIDPNASYDNIVTPVNTTTASAILSLNHYNYTTTGNSKYKFLHRFVSSIGAGFVKANNYAQLDSRTVDKVMQPVAVNTGGTLSGQVVESVSGAVGDFKEYIGLGLYGEAYYPLKKNKKWGNIFFGSRFSYYTDGQILNANTGLYFNLKSGVLDKDHEDDAAPDKFNFSITGQFSKIEHVPSNEGSNGHWTAHSSLVLQVAVPITFTGD